MKFEKEENKSTYKERSKVEHAFAKLKHNYKLNRFRHHGINMNSIVLATYQMAVNVHVLHGMKEFESEKGEHDTGDTLEKLINMMKKSNLKLIRLDFFVI